MSGTLLLDFDTAESDPRFFCLLSLVERAAGRRIVVFDADPKRTGGEKKVAAMSIPAHRYVQWNGEPVDGVQTLPVLMRQQAKLRVAKSLRDKAPVIWVDLDFGDWQAADVSKLPNVVTLNWKQVSCAPPQLGAKAELV